MTTSSATGCFLAVPAVIAVVQRTMIIISGLCWPVLALCPPLTARSSRTFRSFVTLVARFLITLPSGYLTSPASLSRCSRSDSALPVIVRFFMAAYSFRATVVSASPTFLMVVLRVLPPFTAASLRTLRSLIFVGGFAMALPS